jgi:predicted adenylyl cyclase CyaB
MPLEYEYNYKIFDKNQILKRLKELGAIYHGTWIFRVQVFIHPNEIPHTYIRIRDEGHKITMTYKYYKPELQFSNENEVIINDFDQGCEIMLGIGCKKKYYYEKIREIWHIENTEVCWDTQPGIYDIMEIESKSKNELEKYVKLLGLENVPHNDYNNVEYYKDSFGIVIPEKTDLTFLNSKKLLNKYCTKNKSKFTKLVEEQKKLYLSLVDEKKSSNLVKKVGSKKTDSKQSSSKKTGSKQSSSKKTGSKQSSSKKTGSKQSSSKKT